MKAYTDGDAVLLVLTKKEAKVVKSDGLKGLLQETKLASPEKVSRKRLESLLSRVLEGKKR